MAIYPKRKIRHFAVGGALGESDGLFNRPGTFVGLTYTPTNPEIADLEGLAYIEQKRLEAESRLEEERAKRTPDLQRIQEAINEINALPGATSSLQRQFDAMAQDYFSKINENPNYVFSQEGVQGFRRLNNFYSPDVLQRLQSDYDAVKRMQDNLDDSGTGSRYYVKNGRVLVYDAEDGRVKEKSVNELNEITQSKRYQLLTNEDAVNFYRQSAPYGFRDFYDVSGGMSDKEFQDYINDNFDGLGKTVYEAANEVGITLDNNLPMRQQYQKLVTSNLEQRKNAARYILQNMPSAARDYLIREYITKNGEFDQEGFNNSLIQMINDKANTFAVYEEDVDRKDSFIPKYLFSGLEKTVDGLKFEERPFEQRLYFSKDQTAFGRGKKKKQHYILLDKTSDRFFDKTRRAVVTSPYGAYVLGDTGAGKKSSSNTGEVISNLTQVENVTQIGNYTAYVMSGHVEDYDGNPVSSDKYNHGMLVIPESNIDPTTEKPKKEAETGRLYFETEDGRVFVQERAFKLFSKDPGEKDKSSDQKILIPMTSAESIATFGHDYSGDAYPEITEIVYGSEELKKDKRTGSLNRQRTYDIQLTPQGAQLVSIALEYLKLVENDPEQTGEKKNEASESKERLEDLLLDLTEGETVEDRLNAKKKLDAIMQDLYRQIDYERVQQSLPLYKRETTIPSRFKE